MKKKTKVIIEISVYAVILAAIILAVFFHFFRCTRTYDAVIERNGTEKEATVTISYNFFAKCRDELKGTVRVETEDGQDSVEFTFDSFIGYLDGPDSYRYDRYYSYGNVWVDEECQYHNVKLEFDNKKLNNIVLYSAEDKYFIYSATEDFLKPFESTRAKCAGE